MALARYKDLCIDAYDAHRLGEFWGAVLGLRLSDHDDGDAQLDGPAPQQRIWVNTVPERKTVKHRVHLDVHAGSVAELEALGATVVRPRDAEIRWTVMADVEGGEFCAFVRERVPDQRFYALIVDAVDARAQAAWWHGVLGGAPPKQLQDGWYALHELPGTPFEAMLFIDVPEPKTVKNRIHWDLEADDPEPLVARGARVLRTPDEAVSWHVLADPEGNEFCVFTPR